MALADHQPKRKGGHLEYLITTIAEILTEEGHPTEGHHVVQWRNRNVKGANK